MFIVEGSYVSLETGKTISFIEEFRDEEHLDGFIFDLLKSAGTNIQYRTYKDYEPFQHWTQH